MKDEEKKFWTDIESSFRGAEKLLSMADVPEDDPEAFDDMHEMLYHCEVCTVREVMNVVWPPVEAYIDWLRAQIPGLEDE